MTPRFLETPTVFSVQKTALANGGTIRWSGSMSVDWDISGNCEQPVAVELKGRQRLYREKYVSVTGSRPETRPRFVDMFVRCRKCRTCLAAKAAQWRLRASGEYRQSERTWLCTFTLDPASHNQMLFRAHSRLRKAGVKIGELSDDEQFLEREKESFREVQLWMKRLRKNSGSSLRYLAITEKHKSGLPHYHVLLHETDPERPVRYNRHLKASWRLGFAKFNLVSDVRGAVYAVKYLTKSPVARVRASAHYGAAAAAPRAALATLDAGGVLREGEK